MKHLIAAGCALAFLQTLLGAEFAKGDRVELIRDAPLYFKDAVLKVGKSGERFSVILYRADAHKVFLSAQDALGKEIAVSVLESELRKVAAEQLPAPQRPQTELREAQPEEAVYLAETKGGRGSAFLAQMKGGVYLVSNFHVVASAPKIEFKNPSGTLTISSGEVDVADDRDLVRFPVEKDFGLLVGEEAKADDTATAYGNSGGQGVVTKLPGKVLGIGVDSIEVSCTFIPGNSGGPVVSKSGRVIGVASYLTRDTNMEEWIKTGTRFDKARRFALRLSDDTKWTRIPFAQLRDESVQIEAVSELSDYFVEFLNQLLFHSFEAPVEKKFATNQALSNLVDTYNRSCRSLDKKDGAYLTDDELRHSNNKLKGSIRSLCSDLVRLVDSTGRDFGLKAQKIKTPYLQKRSAEIIKELKDESEYINRNTREAAGTNLLK